MGTFRMHSHNSDRYDPPKIPVKRIHGEAFLSHGRGGDAGFQGAENPVVNASAKEPRSKPPSHTLRKHAGYMACLTLSP